jgi:hypothetical protein
LQEASLSEDGELRQARFLWSFLRLARGAQKIVNHVRSHSVITRKEFDNRPTISFVISQ